MLMSKLKYVGDVTQRVAEAGRPMKRCPPKRPLGNKR